ncbi:MAG: hypothetical protein KDK89_20660 [Alphaproteobacteria bacterium]|nr:hypothetical protein [Alphaproteobacteria bacterium]
MKKPIHVYFHVGYEKTGTTSIQTFLRNHEERLAGLGYLYPRSLGKISQYQVVRTCKTEKVLSNIAPDGEGASPERDFEAHREFIRDRLTREIRRSRCSNVIVSSEHVSIHFNRPEEFERFKQLFAAFNAKFTVVIYLREQVELLESRSYTAMVAGATQLPQFDKPAGSQRYLNFLRTLERLAEAFGRDNLIVRLFSRKSLVEGDVVKDFLSALNITGLKVEGTAVKNTSLGIAGLAILAKVNTQLENLDPRKRKPIRRRLLEVLHQSDDSPGYRIGTEAAAAIRDAFRPSNREVARIYFGRDEDLFEPKPASNQNMPPSSSGKTEDILIATILTFIDSELARGKQGRRNTSSALRQRRLKGDGLKQDSRVK